MSANFTHHYLCRNKFTNSAVAGFDCLTHRWTWKQLLQNPHSTAIWIHGFCPSQSASCPMPQPLRTLLTQSLDRVLTQRGKRQSKCKFHKQSLLKAVTPSFPLSSGRGPSFPSVTVTLSLSLPSPQAVCPPGWACAHILSCQAGLDHHSWKRS